MYPPLSSILDKPSQLTTDPIELGVGQKLKGRRVSAGRKRSVKTEEMDDDYLGPKKKRRKSTGTVKLV